MMSAEFWAMHGSRKAEQEDTGTAKKLRSRQWEREKTGRSEALHTCRSKQPEQEETRNVTSERSQAARKCPEAEKSQRKSAEWETTGSIAIQTS